MNRLLTPLLLISVFWTGISLFGDEILPINPAGPAFTGKIDDPIWQTAAILEDTKEYQGPITMKLQSCYDLNKLYLRLDLRYPAQHEAPEVELFLRPEIHGHRVMDFVRIGKEYFSVKLNSSGIISSYYDGKITAQTVKNAGGGYSTELTLDLPRTLEWLPLVPREGDYFLVAVRFKYNHIVMRYPMYFFTNHYNELGPNMAKLLLVGKEKVTHPMLYFDRHVTYRQQLEDLAGDIAELKQLKQYREVTELEQKLAEWEKVNQSQSATAYEEQRYFQQKALSAFTDQAHQARIKALQKSSLYAQHGALFFPVPCYTDRMQVNNFSLPPYELIKENSINLKLTPGETDSFSAAIWSGRPLENVTVTVAPFQGSNGQPVKANLDEFFVKCWYQGVGYTELTQSRILLQPELLVKNPDLVKVDYLNKRNLLQVHHNGRTSRQYPDDSPELLPLKQLPPYFLQQFWVKVCFPVGTPAGKYSTVLTAHSSQGVVGTLPITVEVLNFTLDKAPIASRIYTLSQWGEKSDDLALTEIRSLAAHGVDTVGLFEKADHLKRVVKLMKDGGLSIERIYLQGDGDFAFDSDIKKEKIHEIVTKGLTAKEVAGVKDVYFYLPDEATGERLRKSAAIAEEIHRLGGKTWGAADSGWHQYAGKSFNHVNLSGPPRTRETVNMVHADGNEIHIYNFPQGGMEAPERYRRNFGIMLWASGYDGAMTWCWWWPYEGAERDEWNEFNEHFWKQHCMVYPTKNGIVDTIQFNGWAKGINDLRYLGTLLERRKRLDNNTPQAKQIDALCRELQSDIYTSTNHLEALRERIIDLIRQCGK